MTLHRVGKLALPCCIRLAGHTCMLWPGIELSTVPQGSSMPDSQAERRASSTHASSSGGQGAFGMPAYPGVLPPRASGTALPEQHQSRSKRLASKLLKKMGTKERFRNPHADPAASGEWAMSKIEDSSPTPAASLMSPSAAMSNYSILNTHHQHSSAALVSRTPLLL